MRKALNIIGAADNAVHVKKKATACNISFFVIMSII